MNLGELLEHVRKRVLRDEAVPPLWPDDELTLYFNEAQEQFARRTHTLSDDESDFTFVETEEGVHTYTLDPRVIFVAEVVHTDTNIMLRDATKRRIPKRNGQGRPVAYAMDARMQSMRLSPTPDGVYTLDLLVARRPARLVAESDVPEIPEQYHLSLCDFVAFRAQLNNDPEQLNADSAAVFKELWETSVRDAKRDVYRMRTGQNPKAVGKR